jgi:hypothetical protein
MQALKTKSILSALVLLISLCCEAQNVYSLSVYAGGTSSRDLCSFAFPFPPHQYKLTERSWYENANGLTIMDPGNEQARGGVLQRCLEVECGTNSFSIPLGSVPPKKIRSDRSLPGIKASGDLARSVIQCATSRGAQVTTNTLPVIQVSWVRQSPGFQDIIVVDGDYFTELQKLLEQTYGPPDTTIRSSVPVGNGRSVIYTPQQIGVVLNLTADSKQTIVSVIGRRKP